MSINMPFEKHLICNGIFFTMIVNKLNKLKNVFQYDEMRITDVSLSLISNNHKKLRHVWQLFQKEI